MKTKTKAKIPWNIKVKVIKSYNLHTVDIKISFRNKILEQKIKSMNDIYFGYKSKKYFFKNEIKSLRVYNSDTWGKNTQVFSTHMKFEFKTEMEASLFAEGIERSLDLFIMENLLKDEFKQGHEEQND